jgi:Pyruvate/2-oxoacid:ferredoxin oxidoreductase delta subunit
MNSNEEIVQSPEPETPASPRQVRKKATAVVNIDLCTGCGICVTVCPTKCISIVESALNFNGVSSVDRTRCTSCNICAIDCPWFAIEMVWPDGTVKTPAEYARQMQKQRGYR